MTSKLFWLSLLAVLALSPALIAADDILLAKGERVQGELTGGAGGWKLGNATIRTADVLCVRFSPEPPPTGMANGVFIRGGSLISGTLAAIIGDTAEVSSTAVGMLKLKREDIAGYIAPLPAGQSENRPELARYATLLSSALGTSDAVLQPGKRTVVHMANLDQLLAERVMRVGSEQILIKTKDKATDPVNRNYVRVLEIETPPAAAPTPDDERLGPEYIVRLKGGDLLRGRVVKLTADALTLKTTFMGEKVLERRVLAVMFSAAAPGSGVTWLSGVKPAKSVHVPMFDSEFPARMDSSVGRHDMQIGTLPIERGIGVHSKSEIEFALNGQPSRFVALAGIDASTKGRGQVIARVLADGKEVWKSQAIAGNDEAQVIGVDLGPAKTLTLVVDYGPDGDDSGDHFNWGWAAVVGK
ncbi:MAG TPA: NPCBM/NEW2 domain-containing protein [Planctomycetota bacterium]|nr:NPCBM/NEW2 domain-containing protein [Planctomycetota bacterium]